MSYVKSLKKFQTENFVNRCIFHDTKNNITFIIEKYYIICHRIVFFKNNELISLPEGYEIHYENDNTTTEINSAPMTENGITFLLISNNLYHYAIYYKDTPVFKFHEMNKFFITKPKQIIEYSHTNSIYKQINKILEKCKIDKILKKDNNNDNNNEFTIEIFLK
ncbi:20059_t:CDS:1 [Cetraspora pellucida]|uniref:20059_t:CDS:1 n=1 Tax=Cetraspora pellucida TaxID=1433469 RepID=A0A9N9P9V4_9GLOM|nr:20059_t:CDS:1 [Cetraspora pellucida]